MADVKTYGVIWMADHLLVLFWSLRTLYATDHGGEWQISVTVYTAF